MRWMAHRAAAGCHARATELVGEVLDLVVDFVTYVFVRLCHHRERLLLPLAAPLWGGHRRVRRALFRRSPHENPDNHFRGFPALWNAAAFYLFLLHLPPGLSASQSPF